MKSYILVKVLYLLFLAQTTANFYYIWLRKHNFSYFMLSFSHQLANFFRRFDIHAQFWLGDFDLAWLVLKTIQDFYKLVSCVVLV